MVNNEAIVNIVGKLSEINGAPCKKTLQKVIFLIKAKDVDLGCDYGIHFYGPYSSDLDYAVRELCDEGILNIEYTHLEHKICVQDGSIGANYSNSTVDEIVSEFAKDTPSELELLATALYVYLSDNKEVSKVKSGVMKIKGTKYSEDRIEAAIARLERTGFIA